MSTGNNRSDTTTVASSSASPSLTGRSAEIRRAFTLKKSQNSTSPPSHQPNDRNVYDNAASSTRWNRFLKSCCNLRKEFFFDRWIHTRLWRSFSIFFSLLLLFGDQIHQLWIPENGDIAFDILFTMSLVFFVVDILIRIRAEPNYWNVKLLGQGWFGESHDLCVLGTFLFWCDLLSTLTLLYDISYINKPRFSMKTMTIHLNEYGRPVSIHRIYCTENSMNYLFVDSNHFVSAFQDFRIWGLQKASSSSFRTWSLDYCHADGKDCAFYPIAQGCGNQFQD